MFDVDAFNQMAATMAAHIPDAKRNAWERTDWPSPNVCGGVREFDTLKAWERDTLQAHGEGDGLEARKRAAREMTRRMCRRYGTDETTGLWSRVIWAVVVQRAARVAQERAA